MYEYMYLYVYVYLTNTFHVAVRLLNNRSQITSKCGKNKKVAHAVHLNLLNDIQQFYN